MSDTTEQATVKRPTDTDEPIIELRDVVKTFGATRAVSGVSLAIRPGETVGLIGESGSGKTTVGKLMLGLIPPDSGQITFAGAPITGLGKAEQLQLRSRLQVVFQEPYESLNPRRRIGATLAEPLIVQKWGDRSARARRVAEVLDQVGLPGEFAARYPGELSGGQQQRVGIARAIVGQPQVVVLDEPTASLDRTIRKQVTDLLTDLQRDLGLGYLLITHDIASVRRIAHRSVVMFRGEIVEQGPTADVIAGSAHPYTKALVSAELRAVPGSATRRFRLNPRSGQTITAADDACQLVPICPLAIAECSSKKPPMFAVTPRHAAACYRWQDVGAAGPPTPSSTAAPTDSRTADTPAAPPAPTTAPMTRDEVQR